MVRLLQMGYIGASPARPKTAFSVRLLVHHHAMWLRCSVSTQGFCEALDDFLDSHNPVILTSSTMQVSENYSEGHLSVQFLTTACCQPREWRKPFTVAVDAFRALILQIRSLENQKLGLTELGILAANCPKCFGPPVGTTRPEEPDITVCIDGNFRHRRHAAASVAIPGSQPPRPEMFLDPAVVEAMGRRLARLQGKDGDGVSDQSREWVNDLY